jgi:succinoglycan biosynthesis transport protein ExoP
VEARPQQADNRLRQALAAIGERRWTVVLITLATLAGAAAIVATTERSYTATAEVLVKETVAESARDAELNLETERRIAVSHEVVSRAAPELGLDVDEARDLLSVSSAPGTEILVISASAADADEARRAAEVFADAYLTNRHEQAVADVEAAAEGLEAQAAALEQRLAAQNRTVRTARSAGERAAARAEADVILAQLAATQSDLTALAPPSLVAVGRVGQPPQLPEAPSGAGAAPTLVLALLVGLTLGISAALFKDRLDQRLRDRVDVQAVTGTGVLGAIPPLPRKARRRGAPPAALTAPGGPAGEAYRILRARLMPSLEGEGGRVFLVTSPHAGEGKSATAANLGVVFAQANKRTVVVAADMRRPTLHHTFGARQEPGLSTLLASDGQLEPHLNTVPTSVPNLVFLPSGPLPGNPAELLEAGAMPAVLDRLRQTADVVILDTPPLLSVADTTALVGLVDAVLLVADARSTTRADLADAADALRQVDAPLVGCVLNNFEEARARLYAPEPSGA